jgi:hypothetical protein
MFPPLSRFPTPRVGTPIHGISIPPNQRAVCAKIATHFDGMLDARIVLDQLRVADDWSV